MRKAIVGIIAAAVMGAGLFTASSYVVVPQTGSTTTNVEGVTYDALRSARDGHTTRRNSVRLGHRGPIH